MSRRTTAAGDVAPTYHPLFGPLDGVSPEDFAPEPIAAIWVKRYDMTGPTDALRAFGPDELPDLATLGQMFGSGTYELTARRPGGSIYAKRKYTIQAGPPKAMGGEAPAQPTNGAPSAPSAPAPLPTEPLSVMAGASPQLAMLMMMMQQQREDAARREAMQLQYMQQQSAQTIAMIQALAGMAGGGARDASQIVAATVQAMGPQRAPDPGANLSYVRDVIGLAREVAPPPPPPAPAPPPDDLPQLLGAVAQMVQGVAALAPAVAAPAAPAVAAMG